MLSLLWFHGFSEEQWRNGGLFIIKMCSFKEVSLSSRHVHLLKKTIVGADAAADKSTASAGPRRTVSTERQTERKTKSSSRN